mgnify:CR=1 FL=1
MLDLFLREGRIWILILDNVQSLVSQIMTPILRRFGLAHGIKINQATFLPVKDQLGVGKIPVAKTHRHGRVSLREFDRLIDPGSDLCTQLREDLG